MEKEAVLIRLMVHKTYGPLCILYTKQSGKLLLPRESPGSCAVLNRSNLVCLLVDDRLAQYGREGLLITIFIITT